MKLHLTSSILLFALLPSVFANPSTPATAGKFYAGIFGGGGSSNNFNASQFGTAYFVEAEGGPLAVNAFGRLNSQSTSFLGAQIGYQAPEIMINCSPQWTFGPAAELEGYAMRNDTFSGTLINNTARLPEHNFLVSYPMSRTVFLANAVLNFNHPSFLVHPYIGFGIGNAIIRISGADAAQVAPLEVGVNHYNSSTSDTNSVFAGQIKVGLSYDINQYVSLFADYRWLYLASSHFLFGSTVYPTHAETSSWQVKLDAQRYNLVNIGMRLNW